jgi:ribonuclease HI
MGGVWGWQLQYTPELMLLAEAAEDLVSLGNVKVELAWVPGHDVVEGNCRADMVAKQAAYSR